MEVGGINLTWRSYVFGGAFHRNTALSVFNKAIKNHCVKHSWASQLMTDGEEKPWKSLVLNDDNILWQQQLQFLSK